MPSQCSAVIVILMQIMLRVHAGSHFSSHISVNTPSRSFTHGVGDPLNFGRRRNYQRVPRPQLRTSFRNHNQRNLRPRNLGEGYPAVRPTVPFNVEEVPTGNSLSFMPWQYNNFMDVTIPVLPPSPYKVDSPDPESLWPEGLFLPPHVGLIGNYGRRSDGEVSLESDPLDPYLLEGSEAIAAVAKAKRHGVYYFHDIPHIESLLENQNLRIENNLKPHRIGSIRETWPYNRP